jgi:putative transcriptional regulator
LAGAKTAGFCHEFSGVLHGFAEHSDHVVESANLAPGLLLAMPQLADPNFSRAVVLMIEHSEQGSFGLVINHPSPIKASELLESLEMSWRGEDSAVVWAGGPVSPSTGWVLHEPVGIAQPGQGTIAITSSILLSTSPDRLRAIANQPPRHIRLLLGYSGWGPGQLAQEMARGAWLHTEAEPGLVFDTHPDDIWDTAMKSLGINPRDLFAGRGVN